MTHSCYLVFTRRGVSRMTKTYSPDLKAGEHVIRIGLDVDESLFDPEIPAVTVKVTNNAAGVIPDVCIDESDDGIEGLSVEFKRQRLINQAAGKLLRMGIMSGDVNTSHEALSLLAELKDSGIEVRVNGLPEEG